MRRLALALLAASACALPRPSPSAAPPTDPLRACVEGADEKALAGWSARFETALRLEDARPARDCDFVVRPRSSLDAGAAIVRSAFDGATLAEIDGTPETLPALVALALAPGTQARARLSAQRKSAGFH